MLSPSRLLRTSTRRLPSPHALAEAPCDPRPHRDHRRHVRIRPRLELLEDRVLLAAKPGVTYTVSSPSDDGSAGTLRWAINQANLVTPTLDNRIDFALPEPAVIRLQTALPALSASFAYFDGVGTTVERDPSLPRTDQFTIFTINSGSRAVINSLTISGGLSENGGAVRNGGTLTVNSSTLADNEAIVGGAIANDTGASLAINSCVFTRNAAQVGAAVINAFGATLKVSASTFLGNGLNFDSLQGGAVSNSGTASVFASVFSHNAAGSGGAVDNYGALTLSSSTLSENSSVVGGGLSNLGTAAMTNCTVVNNTSGSGGGIASVGTLTLVNSTIVSNNASVIGGGGGLSETSGGTVILNNTIVALNTDGDLGARSPDDISGMVDTTKSNNNLVGIGGAGGLVEGVNGNRVGVANPMLGMLTDNGWLTPTVALLPGSPAIDAGNNEKAVDPSGNPLDSDQRQSQRIVNGIVDIGAYEFHDFVVDSTADDGSSGTLRWAVAQADALPEAISNISFATGLTGPIVLEGSGLELNATIRINGPGAAALCVQGGGPSSNFSIFQVDSHANASVISGLTIANGHAMNGGAIANAAILTITGCTLSGNSATASGGAIENAGSLTVSGCTFASNSAPTGGAIDNPGNAYISNSTFSENTASFGGAISNPGNLITVNATIVANTASNGGGGLWISGGGILDNTIVAQNTLGSGPGAPADDIRGGGTLNTTASYNNLIGTGGSGGLINGILGNLVGVADPKLGPLADNGGPTQTIALLPNSPAINAGTGSKRDATVPTTDERGAVRGEDGLMAGNNPDIGAYEASSSYLVTTTADTATPGSLRSAVGWANASRNANPGAADTPNTVNFDLPAGSVIDLERPLPALSGTAARIAIAGPGASKLTIERDPTLPDAWFFNIFNVRALVTATISGVTIAHGLDAQGGAVSNAGTLEIAGCTLTENSANQGGAVANRGMITIENSTLSNNTARDGTGGALDNTGEASIADSTFAANSARIAGGAIANQRSVTITTSTFTDNSAKYGGGLANDDSATATLTNSTLTGNAAMNAGGAINSGGFVTAVNCTILLNHVVSAGSGGGLSVYTGTSAVLDNTIVALNTAGAGPGSSADDVAGAVDTANSYNNLIGTGGSGGLVDGVNGNKVGIADPKLGTLADNGGSTQTFALLAGSPAIDAGSASLPNVTVPDVDQRGALRGRAGLKAGITPDIGAYEASSSYRVDTVADDDASGTLRAAVGWANVNHNVNPGASPTTPNTIQFSLSANSTIVLETALPSLSGSAIAIVGPGAGQLTVERDPTLPDASSFSILQIGPDASVTISGLTVAHGQDANGGGIFNSGILALVDVTVAENTAFFSGAGLQNAGKLTLSHCTVANNTTLIGTSAGLENLSRGTVTFSDGTFSGNVATNLGGAQTPEFGGGAIENEGVLTLTNATVAGNSVLGFGAGIYNHGTLTTVNCTIARNDVGADGSGGGLYNTTSASAVLQNTIVALNIRRTGSLAIPDDISGTVETANCHNNLIGTGGAGGLVDGRNGNKVGVANPGLAPLGNYGGPTVTLALLPGSVAINSASATFAPPTDQRGIARPQGTAPDIGAFESRGFTIIVTAGNLQSALVSTPFAQPLQVMVASAFGEPIAGGIVRFLPPSSGASAKLSSGTATIGVGGVASVTAVANAIGGDFSVITTALGASRPAAFALTNLQQPVFSGLTDLTITYGTQTATVSGRLAAGAQVPAGDVVTITLNGVTDQAPVHGDGSFSATLSARELVVAASPYTVTYAYHGHGFFLGTTGHSEVTVTPAPLTILANDESMPFGGAVPVLTAGYVGFVNGDTPANLTNPVHLTTTATSNSVAGTYPITAGGASSPNYRITYRSGTLTVTPYVPPARPVYRSADAYVTTLYHEVLARKPEPIGLKFWIGTYVRRVPTARIFQSFAQSTERRMLEQQGRAPTIPLKFAYTDALRAARRAARQPVVLSSVPPAFRGFSRTASPPPYGSSVKHQRPRTFEASAATHLRLRGIGGEKGTEIIKLSSAGLDSGG